MTKHITAVPISTARCIGTTHNATRVAVFAIDDAGRYCVTTWGRTRADCKAAAKFAEGRLAVLALEGLSATPPSSGVRDVALDSEYGAAQLGTQRHTP